MQVGCSACGKPFEAQRATAKFCSNTCRMRANRQSSDAAENAEIPALKVVSQPDVVEHPLIAATRRELDEAGLVDTVIGQQALRLAEKMVSPFDTGSAAAAVSKEFRAVMAEALKDVGKQADSLDELASRRLKRASGA